MRIDSQTLQTLSDKDAFVAFMDEYYVAEFADARLRPVLSLPRLVDVHGAWQEDLERVCTREPFLAEGLDHFKQAGHLTFWLRRFSPVIEAAEDEGASDQSVTPYQKKVRDLLFGYTNEFPAFKFGYNICLFYEKSRTDLYDKPRAHSLILSHEYIATIAHFLKYKTVSPHAISMIFKSLFYQP